jgi:hypothetical protein
VVQELRDERAAKKRRLTQKTSRERSSRKIPEGPRIKPIDKQNHSQNDLERKQKKKKIFKE